MAEKRALLVGCNYPGTDAELKGCVNDVMSIKSMLLEYYGFQEANITIQIDTDKAFVQPTGKAIKEELARLVSLSKPGDVLIFHFSGHGTQIADPTSDEADGKDEAICPTDLNVICDDDLRAIFSKMPDGVLFTMISDCCHSGSMLDHPEQQISGNKDPNAPPGAAALPVPDLMSMFGMKSAPAPEEQKNRSLDQGMFIKVFNMIKGGGGGTGGAPMDNTNVRAVLQKQFGADGSAKMMGAAKKLDDLLAQHGNKIAAANKQAGQAVGLLRKLLGCILGPSNASTTTTAAAPTGGTVPATTAPGSAAHKPPPNQQLGADKGILITGCQSMETSADACPSGDPKQAFGALTNALTTCVKAAKANDKAAPITYRQLVTDVRAMLLKGGFTQNPCLECSDRNVDTVFIC